MPWTLAQGSENRLRAIKELLEINDREQRRIGQDLHDGLCQQLVGIELMSHALAQKLASQSNTHAQLVSEIAGHVRDAHSQTRSLARGLSPVTIESEGLTSALYELASQTEKVFHVQCRFNFDERVEMRDHAAATHLFRIAQEAVSNAIRHGKARRIVISLRRARGRIVLRVGDNGKGFPKRAAKTKGMGLRIMQSRAGMIGGAMAIERNGSGGVNVTCAVPQKGSLSRVKNRHAGKIKRLDQASAHHRRPSDDAARAGAIDR